MNQARGTMILAIEKPLDLAVHVRAEQVDRYPPAELDCRDKAHVEPEGKCDQSNLGHAAGSE